MGTGFVIMSLVIPIALFSPEAIEAGMIGINTGIFASAYMPFGGIKQSGIGREGAKYGMEEYLELKTLSFGNIK